MSTFDDRQNAYENKFAHDEELRFKIEARTAKLFGLWVAAQLGLDDAGAEKYAAETVSCNLEEPGFNDVKRKARGDLDAKGLSISDHMIDAMLEKLLGEAHAQLA